MKEELKKIIDELKEVLDDSKLYVTNETFLDAVLRIYNTDKINKQKQFNYPKNEFKKETSPLTSKEQKPTDAQIKACKKLNITIPAGASKKDVWKIMNENKQ